MCYGFAGEHAGNEYDIAAIARIKKMSDEAIQQEIQSWMWGQEHKDAMIHRVLGVLRVSRIAEKV